MLAAILAAKDAEGEIPTSFLQRLCAMIANSRDAKTVSSALVAISSAKRRPQLQIASLAGFKKGYQRPRDTELTDAGRSALTSLLRNRDEGIASLARSLVVSMRIENASQRQERLARAALAGLRPRSPAGWKSGTPLGCG